MRRADPPPIASEVPTTPPRTGVPGDIQVPPSGRPARHTTPLAIWSLGLAFGPFALAVVLAIVVRIASGTTPPSGGIFYRLVALLAIGSFVASVVTGIIAIRRVRRSEGFLKGIGLVGVGYGWIVLVIVGGALAAGRTGDELFRDDFEGAKNFWTGEDAAVSMSYLHGGYEILIKDPSIPQTSRSWFTEPPQRALSFEADAVIVRGPEEEMRIGLACFLNKSGWYRMFVGPAGDFAIWDDLALLTEGQGPPLLGNGQTNRLSITCEGGGDEPTVLQLSVNGERVVRFEDAGGYDSFAGIGVFVASVEAGTLVRFDNALAERI